MLLRSFTSFPTTTASTSRFNSFANFDATLATSYETFFNEPSLCSKIAKILFAIILPI